MRSDWGVEMKNGQMQTVKLKPISYKDYVAAEQPTGAVPLVGGQLTDGTI